MESLTNEELLLKWDNTLDISERDILLKELQHRNLFPSEATRRWEEDTGSYPMTDDPNFLQKLLLKREFAESMQTSWKPTTDPCDPSRPFEITAVQRFVSNLMSPRSPYMSSFLYHGVGVGKTCAAIQIAESWLEEFPRQKVFIIAPPTIQQGFMRTLFDKSKLIIEPEKSKIPNTIAGCIGNTYLELSGMQYEQNIDKIERAVLRTINRRYHIFGYISFANYIRDLIHKKLPVGLTSSEKIEKLQYEIIRKEFSGKLLIIDEAHNLRDIIEDIVGASTVIPVVESKDDDSGGVGGKQLTPFLRKVIIGAEGLKLVLMSATPMYNSYKEIIFILNLLLLNDKKAPIAETDIFESDGKLRATGASIIGSIAGRYISFMRGENPYSFPIRLHPTNTGLLPLTIYPHLSPRSGPIPEDETIFIRHLPIIPIELSGDTLNASLAFMDALQIGTGGISSIQLEKIIQAGNFVVPTFKNSSSNIDQYHKRTDATSLLQIFSRNVIGGEVHYKAKEGIDIRWLGNDKLHEYSPKYAYLTKRVASSEGIVFIYSRFVNLGAIPIALALEANGYMPHGRKTRLLSGGIQTPGGRQCAMCPKRENDHMAVDEKAHFKPAYYGIITGDDQLSPNNEGTIRTARDISNLDGSIIKVLIGSQIAAEGIDLRFIREIHIMDSWFHLNKTEQILGRGIRFCSHSALPSEKRNTTTYLYTSVLPASLDRESGDLYSYRIAFRKAKQIGAVTRALKISAIDCNLNRDAIIIAGQPPIRQIDSQRNIRTDVIINDTPFTAICDWIENCSYTCIPEVRISIQESDDSTYDEYAARWRLSALKNRFRTLFSRQVIYKDDDLHTLFDDVPQLIKLELFREVVDNRSFKVIYNEQEGYIHYCNTYYVFQPFIFSDTSIPLAVRMSLFPVKRDFFVPEIDELSDRHINSNIVETSTAIKPITIITVESILKTWNNIVEWCTAISDSDAFTDPPALTHIVDVPERYTKEFVSKYKHSRDAIEWFQTSFNDIPQEKRATLMPAFRKVLIEYFWDKWITTEEQLQLAMKSETAALSIVIPADTVYQLGTVKINRFLNPNDGKIIYQCQDGNPCQRVIIDEIGRDKNDHIQKILVNQDTTGPLYGFIVPKKGGIMVFKTSEPPESSTIKVSRGSECANVSSIDIHISKLVRLGTYMSGIGNTNYGMTVGILAGERKLTNSTRVCALMEIMLRYMDNIHIDSKRWFYRPVPAYYSGHIGSASAKT